VQEGVAFDTAAMGAARREIRIFRGKGGFFPRAKKISQELKGEFER